eukprot:CAMPEP_0179051712 /NCGR_PEP_ID=MMETSP0796-20121207/21385_1 /TAXON_ID=73915 /ORGANISM="Pyrodinium bahamense, Strain pbaha01" /LENGTH=347 /DNA_ID=CAMNT_0020748259 /DNA_START=74 /DNA_END=1117 /DNA_ORIENTATION=-
MGFQTALSPLTPVALGPQAEAPACALLGAVLLTLSAVAWAFELRRRTKVPRFPISLAPEACGLVLSLAVAGVLLLHGSNSGVPVPPGEKELWQQIRNEWPILMTADSLLGLHAMLRTLLLASAALRTAETMASPLAGLPTAFLLGAALVRMALLVLSPLAIYHLDGPLGGKVYCVLQASALALLAYLAVVQVHQARGGPRCAPALAASASLVVLAWLAGTNHLALADPGDGHLDVLFSLQELLELAASVTFLANAIAPAASQGSPGAFAAFAHVMLPLQQVLPAYFLLASWGGAPLEELPALVGAGRPFKMLQLAGLAQVGLYAVAGVAWLVLSIGAEDPCDTPFEV